jgi:hypothetical protein
MSPFSGVSRPRYNLSLVAASVNDIRSGTKLMSGNLAWTLSPPFFFPSIGLLPAPLKTSTNHDTVEESKISSFLP